MYTMTAKTIWVQPCINVINCDNKSQNRDSLLRRDMLDNPILFGFKHEFVKRIHATASGIRAVPIELSLDNMHYLG